MYAVYTERAQKSEIFNIYSEAFHDPHCHLDISNIASGCVTPGPNNARTAYFAIDENHITF